MSFENLRAIGHGAAPSWGGLLVGAALAVLEVLAAGWFFARVYRYAVRTGLIARYSAEGVS